MTNADCPSPMGYSCKKRPGFDRNSVDIKNNINIKRYKKNFFFINSTNIKLKNILQHLYNV